ncbi:MAG: ankyrin repeat domain-containing protein [bacterium]|nr:ankyrin repeat domain-containing protein [bacterium]
MKVSPATQSGKEEFIKLAKKLRAGRVRQMSPITDDDRVALKRSIEIVASGGLGESLDKPFLKFVTPLSRKMVRMALAKKVQTIRFSPATYAAKHGLIELLEAVLKAGAEISQSAGQFPRQPPLMFAAQAGSAEMCELLLAGGADPEWSGSAGMALHEAVRLGHLDAVRALLAGGADPRATNRDGHRPIDLVCRVTVRGESMRRKKAEDHSEIAALLPGRDSEDHHALSLSRGRGKVEVTSARGAMDFLEALSMHEWELLAIRDDVRQAASAYSDLLCATRHLEDVGATRLDVAERCAFAIRLRGNEWSLILQSVDFLTRGMPDLESTAQALSERLDTWAGSFLGTDTSLSVYYQMFHCGASVERVAWDDEELNCFESDRPRPAKNTNEDELEGPAVGPDHADADAFFASYGIYLPACSVSLDPPQVELEGLSAADVERVDWIELEPGRRTAQTEAAARTRIGPVDDWAGKMIKKDLLYISELIPAPLHPGPPTLKDFHKQLRNKRFDEALEVLEALGRQNACRGGFWRHLRKFAEKHSLQEKTESYSQEFRAALGKC